jgi:hypothetical protein
VHARNFQYGVCVGYGETDEGVGFVGIREKFGDYRDVLLQFDDSRKPPRYSLIAVLEDPADEADVRAWLARVSQAVPTELGVADRIEAADADGIAFSTIESSYSADVSQVTWRRDQEEPEGAT